MKKLTFAALAVLIISCAKETKTSLPESMTCLINGESWTADTKIIDRRNNKINLYGKPDGAQFIVIEVSDWGESTYDLTAYECFGQVSGNGGSHFATNNNGWGNIVVSSIAGHDWNKRMSGTFNFTAFTNSGEKIEVTNGKFTNVPFVVE